MYGQIRSALCLSIMLLWTSPAAGNETTPALKLRVAYKTTVVNVQSELHFNSTDLEWFHSCLCRGTRQAWSLALVRVNESIFKVESTIIDCVVDNSADLSRIDIYECTLVEVRYTKLALICSERALDAGLCEGRSNSQPEAQCLSLSMGHSNICGGGCVDFLWDPSQRVRSVETNNSQMHLGSCRSVKSTTTWTSVSTSTDDKDNTTDIGGNNREMSNACIIAGIVGGVVVLTIITIVAVVIVWQLRKHKLLPSNSVPSNLPAADSSVVVHPRESDVHFVYENTVSGTNQGEMSEDENRNDDGYSYIHEHMVKN